MSRKDNGNQIKVKSVNHNKAAMLLIIAVILVLMAVILFQGYRMRKTLSSNADRLADVQQQIDDENQRTQDISDLEQYMQSDEYLEKIAKEKLGLVKDGETIFKEAD